MANKISLRISGNALEVCTPYNPQFVALIKSLPSACRQFDQTNKVWLVDTQYERTVRDWILKVYGEDIAPVISNHIQKQTQTETRILDVWYLGRTKANGDEYIANGMNEKREWRFLFPERVLREWFEGLDNQVFIGPTLYGFLGIQRTATLEEIKSAYRRVVRQWHPDVCKEPNAHEVFILIQSAYEILSNQVSRAKYDAGLALETSLKEQEKQIYQLNRKSREWLTGGQSSQNDGYRAPLRCGYVLAECQRRLNRFYVTKILEWQDIVSDKGVMTASWPAGADQPVWAWV